MDQDRLRRRFQAAKALLGHIEETVPAFMKEDNPPIAFISFDLDYYSSTMARSRCSNPQITISCGASYAIFGSMVGGIDRALGDFTGQSLAIREFTTAHDNIKVARVEALLPLPYLAPATVA